MEKRTQAESLRLKNNSTELDNKKQNADGYMKKDIRCMNYLLYYDRSDTTISNWIVDAGGVVRKSHETLAI